MLNASHVFMCVSLCVCAHIHVCMCLCACTEIQTTGVEEEGFLLEEGEGWGRRGEGNLRE